MKPGDVPAPATSSGIRDGLSTTEAAARLERDGPNALPVTPPPPAWRLLAGQMVHFFALLLWGAGILAFAARMPELGVAIFAVVVINGLFAFAQEYRAERAAERLRDLLPRRATVMRDGKSVEIDASELVVGDVGLLSSGDRISADLRVVEAHTLSIDTSTLTGESVPVTVEAGEEAFAGTFVVEGEGLAVVTTTGSATRLAGIAQLTRAGPRPSTPLAQELDRVVRTIAAIAVGVGSVFFIVSLLVGTPASNGFLFAIGVTVALVPEGLLPTVTLSLAMGAQRMAARHALVRQLDSVETLGSTTFICTDKTGTLTRNEMSVVEAWTPAGRARISGTGYEPTGSVEAGEESLTLLRSLARAAIRCSTGRVAQKEGRWIARGDPMEAALDVFARRLGIDVEADEASVPVTKRFPFDPRRRRMSVVVGDRLFVKGAPDSVCPRCLQTKGAHDVLQAMTERGLRVIAVASRPAHGSASEAEATETELELLGLIGLEDPPRPHAAESVAACREAGIRVAMITGDHPATAEAIARDRPYRAGLHGPPGARTHWGRVGDENLSFVDTPPDSGVSTRPPRPASQVMDHSSLHSSCDRAQLPNAWIMTSLAPFAFSFTRCWWCNASTPGHALRSARPGQLSIGSTERTTCMPAAS